MPFDISFSSREWLDYYAKSTYDGQIFLWSIVEVPLKNTSVFWVVIWIKNEPPKEEEKSICDLICSYPIISEATIRVIKELSILYCLPLHRTLNLFLPKFVFSKLEKWAFLDIVDISLEHNLKKETWLEIIHLINGNRTNVLSKELTPWSVLVFPDDLSIDSFLSGKQELIKDILIYKNGLSYSKKYRLFLDVLKRKKDILIWTRKILQYNLARYEKIVYIEDAMIKNIFNYTDKLRNLDVLIALWNTQNFNIKIITTLPSIELLQKRKRYSIKYRTC